MFSASTFRRTTENGEGLGIAPSLFLGASSRHLVASTDAQTTTWDRRRALMHTLAHGAMTANGWELWCLSYGPHSRLAPRCCASRSLVQRATSSSPTAGTGP